MSPALINQLQVGFTRLGIAQSGSRALGYGPSLMATIVDTTNRALSRRVPVTEIADDVTWAPGVHTWQTGFVTRLIRYRRRSEASAFSSYASAAVRGAGNPADALLTDTDPNNNPSSVPFFLTFFYTLAGAIQQQFGPTLFIDPQTKTTFLPPGSALERKYVENQFETYAQDSWRARHNLTITAGLRYSYSPPLYEASGAQLRPSVKTQDYFNGRIRDMLAGVPSDATPLRSFVLAGKANNAPSWWNPDKNNFAPRFALAYSPSFKNAIARFLFGGAGKSALRAGFGIHYDRVGGPISVSEDNTGNLGVISLALFDQTGTLLASGSRLALLMICYLGYFVVFLCLSLIVSARCATSQRALLVLLGVWFVACLMLPRAAMEIAQRLYPIPATRDFTQEMDQDKKELLSFEKRREQVQARLMKQHGVTEPKQLPVSPYGQTLYEAENEETIIYDQHFARLFASYERQNRFYQITSIVELGAERQYNQLGRELYERAPAFHYQTPGVAWALSELEPAILFLSLWLIALLIVTPLALLRLRVN